MPVPTFLFAASLVSLLQVQSYALPNPQAAAAVTSKPTVAIDADAAEITEFSTLPQSYYDAFTSNLNFTLNSAELASESAAYASYTKEFYATVGPSALAVISSLEKAQSTAYAAWTSDQFETIGTSEYKALTEEYAQWTKEAGVYATYTGTGVPPGITADPVGTATANTTASASVATATAYPPLGRSQGVATSYGVTCLDAGSSGVANPDVNYNACGTTAEDICATFKDASTVKTNTWVWSQAGKGCAMGYWAPAAAGPDGVEKPLVSSFPSYDQCVTNVFGQMQKVCFATSGANVKWNSAAVNIAAVPNAEIYGQQVDAGKISFLLAGSPYPCGPTACAVAGS